MNCCDNHNDKEKRSLTTGNTTAQNSMPDYNDKQAPAHKHKSHLLHMALCCGLPLLILFVLPLIGYKGVLLNIVPFICPIMMLVMIPMMMRGHGGSCHNNSGHTETKSLNGKQQ